MPEQTIELGTITASQYTYTLTTALDAELVDGDVAVELQTVDFDQDGDGNFAISTDGPDFTTHVETYARAFKLVAGGADGPEFAGPANTANTATDDAAPYEFAPANYDAIRTWLDSRDGQTLTLTIKDGRPATPAAPTLESDDDTVTASWTTPDSGDASITSYDVRIKTSSTTEWASESITSSPKKFIDLEGGTRYDVQVRATNSINSGNWSPTATTATHLLFINFDDTIPVGDNPAHAIVREMKDDADLWYWGEDNGDGVVQEWDSEVVYKVWNNGKTMLFFNHSDTDAVILTMVTGYERKGRGGRLLPLGDDKHVSEGVEHKMKGAFDPTAYNNAQDRLCFMVQRAEGDNTPIANTGIAIVRYP